MSSCLVCGDPMPDAEARTSYTCRKERCGTAPIPLLPSDSFERPARPPSSVRMTTVLETLLSEGLTRPLASHLRPPGARTGAVIYDEIDD